MFDSLVHRAGLRLGLVAVSVGLIFALLLGGTSSQGHLSDAVLQLIAIPILIWGIGTFATSHGNRLTAVAFALAFLCVLVPALQVLPFLPADRTTPASLMAHEISLLAGNTSTRSTISVAPHTTILAALTLLPALAVFLGTLRLSLRDRRRLVLVALAIGTVEVFLGFLQVAQGPSSGLRPYAVTNPLDAVGFFANRNHFAALIACLLVFAGTWALWATRRFVAAPVRNRLDAGYILPVSLGLTLIVIMVAALLFTRSRAGLLMAMAAIAYTAIIALKEGSSSPATTGGTNAAGRLFAIAVVLGLLVSLQFALYRVLERFGTALTDDARVLLTGKTLSAAWANFPFGTGLGTFVPVYALSEQPSDVILDTFMNRAHNDYAEVWLETGVVGVLLLCGFAAWLGVALWTQWRMRVGPSDIDGALSRAAGIAILLVLAHSAVDYPLRTSAVQCVFAMCCALVLPVWGSPRTHTRHGHRHEPMAAPAPTQPDRTVPNHRPATSIEWPAETHAPAAKAPPPRTSPSMPARGARWGGSDIDWPDEWKTPAPAATRHPPDTHANSHPRVPRARRSDTDET